MHCVPLTRKVNSVFVELGYSVAVDKIKVIEPWLKVLWSFQMILLHILKRVASTERETPFYLKEQFTQKSSFGWDVKPRSWLSVVIKNPMTLIVKE